MRGGGLAAVLEDGINGQMITLYDKGVHLPLLWTHLIPATLEGKALHNVQNAMFAATMAFAMGVKVENIRQGLRTFDTSYFQVPGRMNVFDKLPFKVILDYGHNPAAVAAMTDLVQRLECSGRRICLLSAPGDRRDEDVRAIARIVAPAFDHVIVRRDDDPRGRALDEIPRLLEAELLAAGMGRDQVQVIIDEPAAITATLELAQPGDIVLLFADKIARSWKQVIYFRNEGSQSNLPVDAAPMPAPMQAEGVPYDRESSALIEGLTLIQDERGVRLAREQEN